VDRHDASTGPRHRCRGSPDENDRLRAGTLPLQRGLGIDAEDRTQVGAFIGGGGSLQRGLGIDAEDRRRC